MEKSKRWGISFIIALASILAAVGIFMIVADPYFHYHGPLNGMKYILESERYQNNGIVKHFEYDAIITGSSMTECFKTSEMDEIFGVKSIKVPFAGGSFKEVNDNLKVAAEHNSDIRVVVRCLDALRFFDDKDYMDYEEYPTYMYDDNLWNDVNYLYNKDIILIALQNLLKSDWNSEAEVDFDGYANWSDNHNYGIDSIMYFYDWESIAVAEEMVPITEEDYAALEANIEQNVIALAREHPEIDFYIYISPYSIYCMDYWWRTGELERRLLAEQRVIELLLPYENIHINSFNTEYEVLCNADNYRDMAHHREELNTQILHWLYEGKHEITKDNYETYCNEVWNYYTNFDYNALFTQ